MTSRLLKSARFALDTATVVTEPRRTGRLVSHDGTMLEAEGLAVPLGGGVTIGAGRMRGEVVGFRGRHSLIVPFDHGVPLTSGCAVEPDGDASLVGCGAQLLGRIIGAQGEPLDDRPLRPARFTWPLAGRPRNPLAQSRVTRPLDVGVRAINGLLTIGEGQRVAIVAGSGVGKSVLMGQVLQGVDCDVVVVGLVGERGREVADFVETKLTPALRQKAVVVAVPADHPPLLRLRAAMRATAIAEFFRAEGKRVVLLLDSLTRVAHAQREIGLALGEPPTVKGYPPSALGLIPRLIERAGNDGTTGGSITALYTVLADGGDTEDPVVDTARAIVDGHIVLSRTLAEQGVFPAIDLGRSLSRTMPDVVAPAHAELARLARAQWSLWEENRDLLLMGAYTAGSDSALDAAITLRPRLLDYLRQPPDVLVDGTSAQAALAALFAA